MEGKSDVLKTDTFCSLAYAEMRLIIARLVWNFDLELDPQSKGWMGRNKLYLLWDKPDLFLFLRPRTR